MVGTDRYGGRWFGSDSFCDICLILGSLRDEQVDKTIRCSFCRHGIEFRHNHRLSYRCWFRYNLFGRRHSRCNCRHPRGVIPRQLLASLKAIGHHPDSSTTEHFSIIMAVVGLLIAFQLLPVNSIRFIGISERLLVGIKSAWMVYAGSHLPHLIEAAEKIRQQSKQD